MQLQSDYKIHTDDGISNETISKIWCRNTLKNIQYLLQTSMETYKGEGTYEPSADELIDVLKNLENLAAINPALYRAIVDQIKGMHLK